MRTILLTLYANIGTIMALKGEAKIKRNQLTNSAYMGMDIKQGDRILTQDKSTMQVLLNDDTVITIGGNSSFDFKKFTYDGTKNSTVALQANSGSFRTVTGQTGKLAPDRFRIKTLSATIGIRGTDFSVYITKDKKEIIQCHSGAIWVKYDNGESKQILANMLMGIDTHNGVTNDSAKAPPPSTPPAPPAPPPPPPPLTH